MKVAYNKSSLNAQAQQLKLYKKVLPSLDLKRRQLTLELSKARKALEQCHKDLEVYLRQTVEKIPMLAAPGVDLQDLVKIDEIIMGEENMVGVHMPILESIKTHTRDYSTLATPAWVDAFAKRLEKACELYAQSKVAERRIAVLKVAVRKATQRVNLFEKVLIPDCQITIKQIKIFLGDAERAAVVRSKLAKIRQQKQAQNAREGEAAA